MRGNCRNHMALKASLSTRSSVRRDPNKRGNGASSAESDRSAHFLNIFLETDNSLRPYSKPNVDVKTKQYTHCSNSYQEANILSRSISFHL